MIHVFLNSFPPDLEFGLKEHVSCVPFKNLHFGRNNDENSWNVTIQQDASFHPGRLEIVRVGNNEFQIRFLRRIEAFRALGTLLTFAKSANFTNHSEQARFDSLGAMIDCSRGAVLQVSTIKEILRYNSLLGLNTFLLYMEDTYKVEGEPFFGYFRGRFTQQELKEVDDYAYMLGIEAIPCIQTLGHLGNALQWPRFHSIRENHEVLLVGSEDTYHFLENLIKTASSPFRSNKIHLGMDEAHGLGQAKHSDKESITLFGEHLQTVNSICQRLGLKPMIWSDMLFTLSAKNNSLNGYLDEGSEIQVEKLNIVPTAPDDDVDMHSIKSLSLSSSTSSSPRLKKRPLDGMDFVYWNYYQTNPEDYMHKIRQHRQLGNVPWFAGGIWTWNRLWAALNFTLHSSEAAFEACRKTHVRNVFATIWGDDGAECDLYSILPGLVYFGEQGYSDGKISEMFLKQKFHAICGGEWNAWFLSCLDEVKEINQVGKIHFPPNPSKWILWNDPIYSFLRKHYDIRLPEKWREIAKRLEQSFNNLEEYPLNRRLEFPMTLANVVSNKALLRDEMTSAYSTGQRDLLGDTIKAKVDNLSKQVDKLWRLHRDLWLERNKPFGLEILESKYGALLLRLKSLSDRLYDYSTGKISTIPEFEEDPLEIWSQKVDLVMDHGRAYTPARSHGQG